MKIAALQIAYLGMSSNRLDYYLRICKSKDVKIVVLGEYVLNRFFKELEKTPKAMLKEQSLHQIKNLKELAKRYEITIVSPLVNVQKDKIYKTVAIFSPKKSSYYMQQILIDYKHWNEKRFFANSFDCLKEPPTFIVDGVKFGVIAGFELHFNIFFDYFTKKNVDVVLLPTASTFDSNQRWREIIKSRAFLGNFYILRANRIGEFNDKETRWVFYGDSMCVDPNGKIISILADKEELLICDIDKEVVKESRKSWGFKRGMKEICSKLVQEQI
ncbi:MAG TPA: carbon-nitrogen hydrolase family protein [Campylobacterales bacterium]|nr:carbon-nitrogen hydrolase family protein [Campylobacterales bacterium]